MKKALRTSLVLAAGLLLLGGFIVGPYFVRVRRFPAEPARGYHADFFLYVSPQARHLAEDGGALTLLVQPNNSGTNSDDADVHRKDAWWTGFGRHGLADELGVALLVPAFVRPATDWRIYTHALDRDVLTCAREDLSRLDLQLLAMVERAREALREEGLQSRERFLLQGYSASGMFANRFTALHPERVLAVGAGSPGGWPIAPVARVEDEALPYPAGIADLEELTGRPFELETYRRVPQLVVMGDLDENDSLDFGDGWEDDSAARVERLFGPTPLSRWGDAEDLYRAAGADARFLLVAGVGHDRRALQVHTTEFFKDVLGRR